jgi:tetratricopeptide (TPR) repeat protein
MRMSLWKKVSRKQQKIKKEEPQKTGLPEIAEPEAVEVVSPLPKKKRIAWFKIAKFFLVALGVYIKKEFGWSFVGRCLMVILVLAALGVFLFHSATAMNQDLGRHLKVGQIIWETKHVPQTNLFSYAQPDQFFLNHHWLSEVIYYLLFLRIGVSGLIVFNALIFLAAFALIFSLAYRRKYFVISLLAMILSIGLLIERTDVRPEVFGFLFFALFLFILDKNKDKIGRSFWALLPLQLVWVNLHISFVFGWILIFLFFLDRFWERRKIVYLLAKEKKFDKYLTQVIFLGILLGLVAIINPNTWRGAIYPLLIFGNYGYTIVENQTPFFLEKLMFDPSIIFFKAAVAVLVASFLINWRKIKVFYLLGSIVFLGFAWSAIRNFPIFGLFLPLVLVGNLSSAREYFSRAELGFGRFMVKWENLWLRKLFRALTILIIFVILTACIYSVVSNRYYLAMTKSERFGLAVPGDAGAAVDFLKQNKISGKMFNNFDIGGYLIWRLYPVQKVFADGRPEAYTEEFWQSVYIPMQQDWERWQNYADKVYNFDYIFFAHTDATPWGIKFVQKISQDKNWTMVYLNSSIAIWLRDSDKNKPIIQSLSLEDGEWPLNMERALASRDFSELLRFGSFFQAVGADDLAVKFFERALTIYSKNARIWLAVASLKAGQGDLAGAKDDLQESLKIDGKFIDAYLALGRIAYQQGDFSQARRAWQNVLDIEPGNSDAKTYLDNMGLIPFKK